MNYYGGDAGEFYTIGNLIHSGIDKAIRDKICILPPLVREFLREKIDLLMRPPKSNVSLPIDQSLSLETDGDSTVLDHLCSQSGDSFLKPDAALNNLQSDESNEPDVSLNRADGAWVPDLTLRYPPTFSHKVCYYFF